MNVLALHGFLGQGSDWDSLRQAMPSSLNWVTPSLFAENSELSLNSFNDFCTDISNQNLNSPKILMGYSMGGRLALELFKKNPENWSSLILISAHPGSAENPTDNSHWIEKFKNSSWKELILEWNAQDVLKNSTPVQLSEEDYDRTRLCMALENLSVKEQSIDVELMKSHKHKIHIFVGEKDQKYMNIYTELKSSGIIEKLNIIKGLGHRLLHEATPDLRAQLVAQLEL